jgi:protein-disulfide isomerase
MAEKQEKKGNLLEKLVPVLLVATIGLAFGVGVLWQKVKNLESGGVAGEEAAQPTAVPAEAAAGEKLSDEEAAKMPEVSSDDHVRGPRDAKLFLIEYSDFQCPFCARFHPTAQQALDEYEGQLAWVYRHFPLDQLHPNARPAAIASECAAELGGEEGFWAFTDKLYEDQSQVSDLAGVAVSVGLDKDAFQSCLDSDKYGDKVEDQYQGGLSAGVRGTPGNFIVNDKGEVWPIPGAVPFETLKETIGEALGS